MNLFRSLTGWGRSPQIPRLGDYLTGWLAQMWDRGGAGTPHDPKPERIPPVAYVQINPQPILDTTRYNGGWIKSVTGLDKSKVNGYSILGEFMRKDAVDNYVVGGLYLDCGIGGSRKNQNKEYTLFTVLADGSCEIVAEAGDSRDWAVELWPAIEAFHAAQAAGEEDEADNPLAAFDTDVLIAELRRRGAL